MRNDALYALAFLALTSGCEDKPKETKVTESDAGRSAQGAVDPKLAEAVAAAGSKAAKSDAGAATGDGPPPTGVFAPGKADTQIKRGDPPKVELGEAGAEPRIALQGEVPPGWKQSGTFDVTLRLGRAQLPPLGVSLTIEAQKPKAPAAGGAAPAAAPAPAADGTLLSAKLTDVKLTGELGPQGKEMAAQLGRMKGSKVDFRVLSGGVAVDFAYQLAKGASPDLEMVLHAVGEALDATIVGFPKEPVGAGGFWLITTRGASTGAEVVSYRLVKLEKVAGDTLSLSVNAKRYAVSHKLELAGLPPGAELEQFQSTTDSKLTMTKGDPLASAGSTKQTFQAQLIPAGGGDQRLGMQSVAEVSIALGKK